MKKKKYDRKKRIEGWDQSKLAEYTEDFKEKEYDTEGNIERK